MTYSNVSLLFPFILLAMQMACWFRKHPVQPAVQLVAAAADELREKHGVSRVGLQG
jgi:hypothetical protein